MGDVPAPIDMAVGICGLSFGDATTLLQTTSARIAGEG